MYLYYAIYVYKLDINLVVELLELGYKYSSTA